MESYGVPDLRIAAGEARAASERFEKLLSDLLDEAGLLLVGLAADQDGCWTVRVRRRDAEQTDSTAEKLNGRRRLPDSRADREPQIVGHLSDSNSIPASSNSAGSEKGSDDPTSGVIPIGDVVEKDIRVLIRMDDERTVISDTGGEYKGMVTPLAGPDLYLSLLAESLAGEIVLGFDGVDEDEGEDLGAQLDAASTAFCSESLRLDRGEDMRPLTRAFLMHAPPTLAALIVPPTQI